MDEYIDLVGVNEYIDLVRVDEYIDGGGDAEQEVTELDDESSPEGLGLQVTIADPLGGRRLHLHIYSRAYHSITLLEKW